MLKRRVDTEDIDEQQVRGLVLREQNVPYEIDMFLRNLPKYKRSLRSKFGPPSIPQERMGSRPLKDEQQGLELLHEARHQDALAGDVRDRRVSGCERESSSAWHLSSQSRYGGPGRA